MLDFLPHLWVRTEMCLLKISAETERELENTKDFVSLNKRTDISCKLHICMKRQSFPLLGLPLIFCDGSSKNTFVPSLPSPNWAFRMTQQF